MRHNLKPRLVNPRNLALRLEQTFKERRTRWRIRAVNRQVRAAETQRALQAGGLSKEQLPVVVFNASTRLTGLSLNAAFSLLSSWGLRLAGVPVVHFVCQAGMSQCVLGINRKDLSQPPPCAACMAQSRRLYQGAQVWPFVYQVNAQLAEALQGLDTAGLSEFVLAAPFLDGEQLALGELVLPSIRWTLRRHNLIDDEATRSLLRQFMLSAYQVGESFAACLQDLHKRYPGVAAALIFNGMMYPEAMARCVAQHQGVQVITHEVGFQKFSMFLSEGQATAYPIEIPADFELNEQQQAMLDAALAQRFKGHFSMAGIRFWPEMRGLDQALLEKMARFRQVVPVFTNVVYDTSQVHANRLFPHMFAWLDQVLELIRAHPETLFVIRAHPDEMRPGTGKQAKESVQGWVDQHGVKQLDNVVFIDSQEYLSSYELVQRAKFVMVYNSSIGMESALLGRAVLCAGKARYTQYPMVYFPESTEAFASQAKTFLQAGLDQAAHPEPLSIPPEFERNARRFLYYQMYRAALPMERFIESGTRPGFVHLRAFRSQDLLRERAPAIQVLYNGLMALSASGASTTLENQPAGAHDHSVRKPYFLLQPEMSKEDETE